MKLLMLSGDRATSVGERGPFFTMQEVFSKHWERIDVLCPQPQGAVTVRTIHGNVFLHPSSASRLRLVSSHVSEGRRLLAEHRHDALVSHDYGIFTNGRAAARLARETRTPWMSELFHVPGLPRAADLRERIDPCLARAYVKFALRCGVTAFRVMNHREMPPFLRGCGVPEERIRFLSALYLDLETFRPKSGIEKSADLVLVGRMVPNKGIGVLLDALARLAPRRPALRARLVGRGPLRASLESKARRLGLEKTVEWVDWLETREQLADLYRSARLLVCASFNEGGPRVTCEAMACGTPCVSTPVGVMPDLIRHGENGWLCGFDAESLARTIDEALSDPERAAGRCREAVEPFESRKTIGLYAEGLKAMAKS